MDPSKSLRAYGSSNHSLQVDSYNNHLIGSDSYNFLTGTEVLDESRHSRGPPHAEGRTAQNSGEALLGGLYSSENSPSADFSNQSSQTPKSNSWESVSEAGLYSDSLQSLLISGENVLPIQPATGLQVGSYDGGHSDPTGVYYPPNSQQGAMQLYYVNAADYSHEFNNVGRPSVTSPLLYSQQDGGTSHQQGSCAQSKQQYDFPFLPCPLQHDNLHQQALEAIDPMEGNPLSLQGLSAASRNGSREYSNWRNGGNEHSFIPMNNDSHSSQSRYDTNLPHYGVGRACHDLSHMHQTDNLQGDVGHGLHLDHSHGACVSGQGLSLSLSSHEPQSAGLHYQPGGGHLSEADHINAVAQAAVQMAKTKELASRYLAGGNADLSRFRTPSRDDILGSRFQLDPVNVGGRKHVESGPSEPTGSSDHFSASRFLRIAQDVLNEVCRVSASKKPPKPARSSEWHWTMAAGSSASADKHLASHGKEDRVAILTEVDSVRDSVSFANISPLVTVSHILPHESELVTNLTDLSRTNNRDDLELTKGKLSLMLDEVESRYRRYCDHLQLVILGFNNQAGPNAATPYTILALQAMSRHFRCLRDAIGKQLKTLKRALGEDDRTGPGETSRLRHVDQQIRQQRALQQLGMLQQHAWRPQRGLPERAVSVLRAWLFEHFLHPYPKDVDKMYLAKQTGLTRSQVSNWFINARVRLWKPMVEEMYLEEQREADEAAMSERRAREQVSMNISFEAQYEGCRDRSGLLNDVTRNGQSSSCMPKEFSVTDRDGEPNTQGGQGPAGMCLENTIEMHSPLLVVEHHLNGRMADTYHQEGREPKKSRNDAYDPSSAPTTSTGVSLTLGLQNCEANLRTAMGSSSMLSTYTWSWKTNQTSNSTLGQTNSRTD